MLVGMALGDGWINVRRRVRKINGRGYPYESRELMVRHSVAQADYCEHKASLVRKALNRSCSMSYFDHGPGKKYKGCGFTVSHPYFGQLKTVCYPGGRKTFTARALEMLTVEGLALWYMDDGSVGRNVNKEGRVTSVSTDIATMCSKEEAETIKCYFLDHHGITFNIRCDVRCSEGHQFYIQANTAESRKFVNVIGDYVIPSMQYKIAHVAELDSHECQAPFGSCITCGKPVYANRHKGLCVACYSRRYYRETRRFREGRKPAKNGFYKGDEIVRPDEN